MSNCENKEEQVEVKGLTSKELKKLAKPEFAANPDKYYPTATFAKLGFSRAQCPECGNNYWRHSEARKTCGDSQCEKKYTFIGRGTGIGRQGKKITYADAWKGFERSLTSARVPCTSIARYPVVARWRADVDFVAAGIFCFQPYCVTGELAPPANPLICPQFCLRFNDLDNIGLTGRHYSGFIMLGIQVFNLPNDYKFWNEECVEFNYRWLTEELGIDPDEITFIEDVWAGGGNLGPSIEYFVNGLELGNMVFMQFKTYPDGSREPLQVKVIDVGIGLERVPWLINGTATSYMDVFPSALNFLLGKVGLSVNSEIWDKYGPLSCLLNVDEVEDLEQTWKFIADQIGMEPAAVKSAIDPIRDAYVICDHTRCVLMAISDGSLPSNVGGASNVRNILRRVFATLKRRGWWEKIGMEGLLELFEQHRKDLASIYGQFPAYKSFNPIIELEYERWLNTDAEQKTKLEKLMKKKGGKLDLQDWITAITAYGLPADTIAAVTKQDIPGNLWYAIAELQERTVKTQPAVLYSTAHLPETDSLYYADHHLYDFEAKILQVMPNVTSKNEPSVIALDRSAFYPTSGGQEHDTGKLVIDGITYDVVDVMKVGPAVLHVVHPPLPVANSLDEYKGKTVKGSVDVARRAQLRCHHTATHIVFAAARRVLGPHVWQNGAKKTVENAHLDITQFKSLSNEEVLAIESEARRIVLSSKNIKKGFMPKDEAEKKHGFSLYQGGVVPGNSLRVVSIEDTDNEACCGTHCDNTSEVGIIKIYKALRISDGIVRLYFVAGERSLALLSQESSLLNNLCSIWKIPQTELLATATRFTEERQHYSTLASKQSRQIVEYQIKNVILDSSLNLALFRSSESNPTLFISQVPIFAEKLKQNKKGIVFAGDGFVYGLIGDAESFDVKKLQPSLESMKAEEEKRKEEERKSSEKVEKPKPVQVIVQSQVQAKSKDSKAKAAKIDGVQEFKIMNAPANIVGVLQLFQNAGFKLVADE